MDTTGEVGATLGASGLDVIGVEVGVGSLVGAGAGAASFVWDGVAACVPAVDEPVEAPVVEPAVVEPVVGEPAVEEPAAEGVVPEPGDDELDVVDV